MHFESPSCVLFLEVKLSSSGITFDERKHHQTQVCSRDTRRVLLERKLLYTTCLASCLGDAHLHLFVPVFLLLIVVKNVLDSVTV